MNHSQTLAAKIFYKIYPYCGMSFAFFTVLDIVFFKFFSILPGINISLIHEIILLVIQVFGLIFGIGLLLDRKIKNEKVWKFLFFLYIIMNHITVFLNYKFLFDLHIDSSGILTLVLVSSTIFPILGISFAGLYYLNSNKNFAYYSFLTIFLFFFFLGIGVFNSLSLQFGSSNLVFNFLCSFVFHAWTFVLCYKIIQERRLNI